MSRPPTGSSGRSDTARSLPLRWILPGCANKIHRTPLTGLAAGDDLVDQAVLPGLLRGEVAVPLDVGADLLDRAAGMPGQDRLHLLAQPDDLPGLDLHVAGLAVPALGARLVDEDAGVGQ